MSGAKTKGRGESSVRCNFLCPSQNYIQELRTCSNKEQEKERVDKELGKIRKKYTSEKSLSGMAGGGKGAEDLIICLTMKSYLCRV